MAGEKWIFCNSFWTASTVFIKMNSSSRALISKADLHVHSKYSSRPSEWFLRRIGAPESYIEPLAVYEACKARGMDYVTISDHNCIGGALDIAHLPGTFLSSELTTYFPENGCKIHCLVSGITEKQFAEMSALRENIYDLHSYMNAHEVIHSIAHPLFCINGKLTIDLFEKLLVLFNCFEGINGSRHPRACEIGNTILNNLTPKMIQRLADRHNIIPTGSTPWKKKYTGGSDDHGGLYIASAYTTTPSASTVAEYLNFIRNGACQAAGSAGTSVRLANSLYRIAYSYYKDRFLLSNSNDRSIMGVLLRKLAEQPDERKPAPKGLRALFRKKITTSYIKRQKTEIEQMVLEEFSRALDETPQTLSEKEMDRANFESACRLSQTLSFAFIKKATHKIQKGELIGSLQAISSLGPVALGITPYLTAFSAQHKDEEFLQKIATHFPATKSLVKRTGKKAWITDTFNEVNGVTKTIKTLASLAQQTQKQITVITCLEKDPMVHFPLKNFKPVGTFNAPEYGSLKIAFPPFMEIIDYLEKEQFDELIISTPGTLGLCALAAAKILGLSTKGIYHTDFPRFLSEITEDEKMGEIAWRFMRWFYDQMDQILVPTQHYKQQLIEGHFEPNKIKIMPRGIHPEKYNPNFRNLSIWEKYGLEKSSFKLLYVGRISKEKNIENLLKAFKQLDKKQHPVDLILVGDGPQRNELMRKYNNPQIIFTGYLHGKELSQIYASSDLFIFPSCSDTFGNAVLEAHASGLPAIVSTEGGPQEIVQTHQSGLVVNTQIPSEITQAILRMITNKTLYNQLKKEAQRKAQASHWNHALEKI